MRSRWYHHARLNLADTPSPNQPRWLDLCFDLVFITTFLQLGSGLSGDLTIIDLMIYAGLFALLWLVWAAFAIYGLRFQVDDFAHRMAVFAQFLAVGGLALGAPGVFAGEIAPFAYAMGASFFISALMQIRSALHEPRARAYCKQWGILHGLSAIFWLISAQLPANQALFLWILASVLALAAPFTAASRSFASQYPMDFPPMADRFGRFTLFILAQSYIRMLMEVVEAGPGAYPYREGILSLIIIGALWWIYFDDVAGSQLKAGRNRLVTFFYAHIPLQLGVALVGVGLSHAIGFSWQEPAPAPERWLLTGALALVFMGVAGVDSVSVRKQAELSDRARIILRWISALVILCITPVGTGISGGLFFVVVGAICLLQVLLDMVMAPFESGDLEGLGAATIHSRLQAAAKDGTGQNPMRRADLSKTIYRGIPSELRRDLYAYFMDGSWLRVFMAFMLIFFVVNIVFAALYILEAGSIRDAAPGSFMDAFWFSVQTMSTIGYGTLSPANTYGNSIVAIEAAGSIILMAITTGLMVAKASQPKTSVLFSQPFVITRMNGQDVLSFRVGNARGNDLVDASLSVSVIRDEFTQEGEHFRRLTDIQLVRDHQPIFRLSWTVMHIIDESSPLFGMNFEGGSDALTLIATLIGHDATYGQTAYAQNIYDRQDLRYQHRFVDVIHQLDDGRLMIDYTLFHDTISLGSDTRVQKT